MSAQFIMLKKYTKLNRNAFVGKNVPQAVTPELYQGKFFVQIFSQFLIGNLQTSS
jgi:hypothetical protein